MARTTYSECLGLLRDCRMDDIEEYQTCYIGSFMSLDPCGRYHHAISPNGLSQRCERYWEALEKAAGRLGGWIESGEGDPTDIFFCLPHESKEVSAS